MFFIIYTKIKIFIWESFYSEILTNSLKKVSPKKKMIENKKLKRTPPLTK